jgi:hypothetical protein
MTIIWFKRLGTGSRASRPGRAREIPRVAIPGT